MTLPPPTPSQLAQWGEDRRPALYGSLIVLVIINNLVAGGRFVAHWRAHYRREFSFRTIFAEDYFILLGALCINVVVANLLAATHYGLGLHSWRINAEDPSYPRNLSDAFKHVWITMIFTGPTFTSIKLALLFFYRRLFLVNQRWLSVAWWVNLVYVVLWFFGATGFYLFQCWPVQWYFMQYYHKYHVTPPYAIAGQCNATSTVHVAIPLIFGLFSDIMILVLPLATIFRLQMSPKAKMGLSLVFSVGIIACLLDLVRIVELWTDTDDKDDPSYGVVIFLILSAATEVAAIVCASMPVVGPEAFKEYKRRREESSYDYAGHSHSRSRLSKGFEQLGGAGSRTTSNLRGEVQPIALSSVGLVDHSGAPSAGKIWVESEVKVTVDDGLQERNRSNTPFDDAAVTEETTHAR